MNNEGLVGRTALVTGAARRIGRDVAIALAGAGVNVVIHYRNSAKEAESLRTELIARGVKAWAVRADFARHEEVRKLLDSSIECAGFIDFLINNAASFVSRTIEEMDFKALVRDIQVNAWSPFVLSRVFARRSGRGKIINLVDTRVTGSDRTHVSYILSKKLLLSITEILAVEFAPRISVNAIAPGLILPPAGKDERYLEELAPTVPLEKHGGPADISEAVLYLLGSSFVTGQVLYIDGGRHLRD